MGGDRGMKVKKKIPAIKFFNGDEEVGRFEKGKFIFKGKEVSDAEGVYEAFVKFLEDAKYLKRKDEFNLA